MIEKGLQERLDTIKRLLRSLDASTVPVKVGIS